MDEEKIKRLKEKIAQLRKLGKENKAMNLEKKIQKKAIKKDFKQNKTRTNTGQKIQDIKKKVKETFKIDTTVTPVKKEYMEDTDDGKKYHVKKTKKMLSK
jgi:hypothetical protein